MSEIHILIISNNRYNAQKVDQVFRKHFSDFLIQIDFLNQSDQALDFCLNNKVDLLLAEFFVDNESIETVLELVKPLRIPIILFSSHIEKAFDSYRYQVIHFIKNPLQSADLIEAINRFLVKRWQLDFSSKHLIIKNNYSLKLLKYLDILYLEAFQNYIKVHKKNGKYELIRDTLKHIEKVTPQYFKRIHKSYLVNTKYVSDVNELNCIINGNIIVPISSKKLNELVQSI